MKFVTKHALIILLCTLPFLSQGQAKGYIVIDGAFKQGYVLQLSSSTVSYSATKNTLTRNYGIDSVSEFGIKDRKFVSLETEGNSKFYEELVKGEFGLFKEGNQYLLMDEGRLISLDRKNYQDVLSNNIDCIELENIKNAAFSKATIVRIVDASNRGICDQNYDDLVRWRIRMGAMPSSISTSDIGSTNELGFSFALQSELAIRGFSGFYLTSSLSFADTGISLYDEDINEVNFARIEHTTSSAEIAIKWVMPRGKVRPYLLLGGRIANHQLSSPTSIINTIYFPPLPAIPGSGDFYAINLEDLPDSNQWGVDIFSGVGVEAPLVSRFKIFAEVSRIFDYGVSMGDLDMDLSQYLLSIGIQL